MNKRYARLLPLLLVALSGCYYDKEDALYPPNTDCSTIQATYAKVAPVITAKCATSGCHNAASAAGATVLETYDQVKAKADRINQRTIVDRTMPPVSPLSADEIALLKCWIGSGSPNN